MKKRLLLMFLAAVLVISCLAVPSFAANEKKGTYEVVLLMDVSGSMNYADPGRIAVEVAKSFADYYPSNAEYFKISVILYNTEVMAAVTGVDVKKDASSYKDTLTQIGNMEKRGQFGDFSVWTGNTDIGGAVKKAQEVLDKSSAEEKFVILFTDGRIDLDGNFAVTTQDEKDSESNSFSCADAFKKAGIPIYAVGLNYNNGVDQTFMQKLADKTGGKFLCSSDKNELIGHFQKIFADMMGGFAVDDDPIKVEPGKSYTEKFNIYGQAISEANVVLFSTAEIASFTLTNPNGVVVAQSKDNGESVSDDSCIINRNKMSITAKLLKPMDGNWSLTFVSAGTGEARIGEIYLYNLQVVDDCGDKATVGSQLTLQPALFNADKDTRITSQSIYADSTCHVTVSNSGTQATYQAKLNSAKNGYTLDVDFDKPGEYDITYKIVNKQFEVESSRKLQVLAPGMKLSCDTTTCQRGDVVNVTGQIVDTLTGKDMSLPGYLAGGTCKAEVSCDGEKVDTITGSVDDSGKVIFTYSPKYAGEYSITASISRYDDVVTADGAATFNMWWPMISLNTGLSGSMTLGGELQVQVVLLNPATSEEIPMADYLQGENLQAEIKLEGEVVGKVPVDASGEQVSFSFVPEKVGSYTISVSSENFTSKEITVKVASSTITANKELGNISESVLFDEVSKEIDLSGVYTDSDGDALSYQATSDCGDITVRVEGGKLLLNAKGGASGTITITVTDGEGAEFIDTFDVNVESMMTLFIIAMVVLAVIIIATPILLIIIRKRSVPRLKYRIKVVLNPNDANRQEGVFEVARASSNRRCKPVMTLKEILNLTTLTSNISMEMTQDELTMALSTLGDKITVTGFAFKNGLKIQVVDPKAKNKAKVFTNAIVNVIVKEDKPEDALTMQVYFGKTTAL